MRVEHIFKGLRGEIESDGCFFHLKEVLAQESVWVETDNRAHMSLGRRKVIHEVGKNS